MFYRVTGRRDGRPIGLMQVGFPTPDSGHTDAARSAGIVSAGTITGGPRRLACKSVAICCRLTTATWASSRAHNSTTIFEKEHPT